MKRYAVVAMFALVAADTLSAQSPKGWMVRADRSTTASDPDGAGSIKFTQTGNSFHALNPQAAVYWTPANTASGAYTVKGTFTLLKPSGHTNYYGIVFGGTDLDKATQSYSYFLVAQDGSWLIKKREGDANASDIKGKTMNDAVKKPGADGKSINALEVRVGVDKVDFAVNGTVVHSMPKAGLKTDGIYGIRVNHLLEVQIDNFGKS